MRWDERAGETQRQEDGEIKNDFWVEELGERSHFRRGGNRRKVVHGKLRMLLNRLSLTYKRLTWKSQVGR